MSDISERPSNLNTRLTICSLKYDAFLDLARIVKEDIRLAGLTINWDKSDGNPLHECLYLGFDVDLVSVF